MQNAFQVLGQRAGFRKNGGIAEYEGIDHGRSGTSQPAGHSARLATTGFRADLTGRLRRRAERLRPLDGLVQRPSVRRHHPRQLPVDEGASADRHGRLAGGVSRGPLRSRPARRDLALCPARRSLGAGVQGADDHRQPRQADPARARPARHAGLRRPRRSAAGPIRHHLVAGPRSRAAGAALGRRPALRADLRAGI